MIYVWLPRFLCQAAAGLRHIRWLPRRPRLYKEVTDSCGGVRVEGREEELTCSNENLLCFWSSSPRKMETTWECCMCLCCCVKQQCPTDFKFRVTMAGVGFNSCYILRQQCDSKFRSVQTMRLTRFCSPQPQCKLYFLNPVPLPYAYRTYGFWYDQRMPLHLTLTMAIKAGGENHMRALLGQ